MKGAQLTNPRKTPRLAAAAAVTACMVTAFAALGGVGLAQNGGVSASQYDPNKKAQVCHKGKKTLTIGKAAVPAHLRHGDTLGTCASAAAKAKKAKAAKAKAAAAKAAAAKKKAEKAAAAAAQGKAKGK